MKRLTSGSVFVALVAVGFLSCSGPSRSNQRPLFVEAAGSPSTGSSGTLVVIPESEGEAAKLASDARELGLEVRGSTVLTLSGAHDSLARLGVDSSSGAQAVVDQPAFVKALKSEESGGTTNRQRSRGPEIDLNSLYMGAGAFGIPDYLKENPTHDGRGIIFGLLDDGISPHQSGMVVTSDGKRKVIAITELNQQFRVPLQEVSSTTLSEGKFVFSRALEKAARRFHGQIVSDLVPQVRKAPPGTDVPEDFDLNLDGRDSKIVIEVGQMAGDRFLVCVDKNADSQAQDDECFGTFEASGDVRFWDLQKRYSLIAEVGPQAQWVHLTPGERLGDSHGEGVASVAAAFQLSGRFNGVAPGAQVVSYGWQAHYRSEDQMLSVAQFLEGLEWLGSKGAKVINFSAFTYLGTSGTQAFLYQALKKLNQKYNFVLTVAAGNDGPGLNSNYERTAYFENALLIGAYLDPVQDHAVYGNVRSNNNGRPIWYSSVGPGFDGGQSIDCVSPLASLSLQDPDSGAGFFAGTSSAAPHLAGFAAVLASAVQAAGLPWDSMAAAHAIRLSGRPLTGVPYVQQGRGVPQIRKAIRLYSTLLEGQRPLFVRTEVQNVKGGNGVPQKTPVIFTSRLNEDQEISIALKGTWISRSSRDALLPVSVEYSHPWLQGPDRSWIGEDGLPSSRRPTLRVALLKDVLMESIQKESRPSSEIFAEVRLKDSSGQLIEVIPVTVIHEASVENGYRSDHVLDVQFSERIHLRATAPGILHLQTSVNESQRGFLDVRLYDGKSSIYKSFQKDATRSFWIQVREPGWIQVGLSRMGGSALPMKVSVQGQILRFSGLESTIDDQGPIALRVHGTQPVDLQIGLFQAPKTLVDDVVKVPESGLIQWMHTVTGAGAYDVTFSPMQLLDYSYPSPYGTAYVRNPEGKLTRLVRFVSAAIPATVNVKDVGHTAEFVLRAYESGAGFPNPGAYRRRVVFTPESDANPIETHAIVRALGNFGVPLSSAVVSRVGVAPSTPATAQGGLRIRARILPGQDWIDLGTMTVYR